MKKNELIKFENKVKEEFEKGNLPYPIHFSGGNEDQLIKIFKQIKKDDWVFSTHRSHYHYLLHKKAPKKLMKMIREGKSMHIFDKKFFTSSIVAGICAIAVGVALALKLKKSKNKVWCFVGDGAEDNGHFYEAVKYSIGHKLPIKFVIEDNNKSVETSKKFRHNYDVKWNKKYVIRYKYNRTYPHVQTGKIVEAYL